MGVLEEVQKEVGVMLYSKCMAQIHRQLSNKKNAQKVSKKQQVRRFLVPRCYLKIFFSRKIVHHIFEFLKGDYKS